MMPQQRIQDSTPSPCGRGMGGGVVRTAPGNSRTTPPPCPLPQGEGEESLP